MRKGGADEPIALNTLLGWVVSGEIAKDTSLSAVSVLQCSIDDELSASVRRFWEQEKVPKGRPPLTPQEQKCLEHFGTTHSRRGDGRYVVRLPLASDVPDLHDTRYTAARSLLSTERRFQRDTAFQKLYKDFMNEYEELEHMTPVATAKRVVGNRLCFLPHHGVFREASATTKLRVVFNGSQRTRAGHSLNDALEVGPNFLPRLADVLLAWHQYRFVYASDVEKMYRQILLHRDLQRIIWRKEGEMQEYR